MPYKEEGEGTKKEDKHPQIPPALFSEYAWSQLQGYFPVKFSSQHKYTWKYSETVKANKSIKENPKILRFNSYITIKWAPKHILIII